MHYFNITMRNVVKVLYKDTIPKSGSGSSVGGSGMLDEEEIMKLLEKEEMAELELQKQGKKGLNKSGWRNVDKNKSWMRNMRDNC
ncbi:hypothetical protein Tco_0145712 [Tanacetum coccineum]|uniref:Uncharacterized protein n=1 Tax=Tanacetum coccineum TaxID=301880 RepID=A0ABQ5HFS9_9ASTR